MYVKPPKLQGSIVVIDSETDGVNPYKGNRIFCWAYLTELGEIGFMYKTSQNLTWVRGLFMDPTKTIIFHNAKFDLKMFFFEKIDIFRCAATIDCTLILANLHNSSDVGKKDLRHLAQKVAGRTTEDKDYIKEWLKKKNTPAQIRDRGRKLNFSDVPHEIISKRAEWDVVSTLFVYRRIYPIVMNLCPKLYRQERELMFACIEIENTGVEVDITKAAQLKQQCEEGMERIQKILNDLILPIEVTKKVKGEPTPVRVDDIFNPQSPLQLPAAFEKLGIRLKYKTEKGGWCFDNYAMLRYVSNPLAKVMKEAHEKAWDTNTFIAEVNQTIRNNKLAKRELLPPLVLQYRRISKLRNTYYGRFISDSIDEYTTPTGSVRAILHCSFNQSEAKTGRFSSSKPNLQNISRVGGPRTCFVPRKGCRNWYFDYSQVEMRLFVHFAQDDTLKEAIEHGDIHTTVAQQIFAKKKVSKEERYVGKTTNFSIIYGAGAKKLAETLTKGGRPTSEGEARQFLANYHRAFPSVRRIQQKYQVSISRNGYIDSPFNRRYYIDAGYKALNYICQGTSADIIKTAIVRISKQLKCRNLKSRILMTIHDEIVLEIPRKEETIVPQMVKHIMEDHSTYRVPLVVEAEIAKYDWSLKKKVDLSAAA